MNFLSFIFFVMNLNIYLLYPYILYTICGYISSADGKYAKEYQEKDVSNAIKRIEEIKKVQEEEERAIIT